jgi:hypothetical protein
LATTAKGYRYPVGGDSPDGATQIKNLADDVDATPGVATFTYAQINALAGGSLWEGRMVYQTDTGTNRPREGLYAYNGVNWRLPWTYPWGLAAAPTSFAGGATTYSGFVNIPSLPITFTAVANRYYKVTCSVPWHNNTANDGAQLKITDSVAGQLKILDSAPNDNTNGEALLIWTGTFAAGSHTITPALAHGNAGTVTIINPSGPAQMWIEDLGPSGSPT